MEITAKQPLQRAMERSKEQIDRSKDRVEAVALNKEIAQHASRKQLTEAMTLFEKAISLNWANSHTYAAAINANVRCGCVAGAADLFERLRKTKGLKLDVITCTTMMKGFCGEGDILKSSRLFDEMDKNRPPIVPNIRTINTFLRGCVVTGEVEQAEKILLKTQKEYSLTPDVSTWEYVVTLLCQGLRLEKALPIVGRLKGDATMKGDLGAINVNLARAASLLGDWKACKKTIQCAIESINLNEQQEGIEASNALESYKEKETEGDVGKIAGYKREATGGKKAWNIHSAEDGYDSRAQSLEVFRKHKREG
jgi:pentatricopeptide repeat protein